MNDFVYFDWIETKDENEMLTRIDDDLNFVIDEFMMKIMKSMISLL